MAQWRSGVCIFYIRLMEKKFKRTLVTTALPYANGPVHIGHLAGVYVPADIYVRYLRLKKRDVIFIGGSDEHGVPVTIRARKEGITVPKDEYDYEVQKAMEAYGYSDVASYEKDYPKQETIDSLIYYKVLKFVGDKAKVVKDSETTTIASDSTDTSTESETTTAVE